MYHRRFVFHPQRIQRLGIDNEPSGVLNFVSEILVRHFAGVPSKPLRKDASILKRFLAWTKISGKAIKLGLYGAFVAAPMSHFFVTTMHRAFAGRKWDGVQWHMICTSMLLIAPIQISAHLANLSLIENGPSEQGLRQTFKAGFVPAVIVTWLTAPPSLAYAQRNFPFQFEMPFFNIIQFFTGVSMTSHYIIALNSLPSFQTLFGTMALKAKTKAENDQKRR